MPSPVIVHWTNSGSSSGLNLTENVSPSSGFSRRALPGRPYPSGGTVVEDPFFEVRGRGREAVPGVETRSRFFVPRFGGFFGSSRAGQAGGLGEQGPAEVDVVEDHEGFRIEALVFDLVFDPDA